MKVSPFIVVILHIPEICVILCMCVQSNGEDMSRDLGENCQEVFGRCEWRRLHVKSVLIFICFHTLVIE
jgi:hypothetical protein